MTLAEYIAQQWAILREYGLIKGKGNESEQCTYRLARCVLYPLNSGMAEAAERAALGIVEAGGYVRRRITEIDDDGKPSPTASTPSCQESIRLGLSATSARLGLFIRRSPA